MLSRRPAHSRKHRNRQPNRQRPSPSGCNWLWTRIREQPASGRSVPPPSEVTLLYRSVVRTSSSQVMVPHLTHSRRGSAPVQNRIYATIDQATSVGELARNGSGDSSASTPRTPSSTFGSETFFDSPTRKGQGRCGGFAEMTRSRGSARARASGPLGGRAEAAHWGRPARRAAAARPRGAPRALALVDSGTSLALFAWTADQESRTAAE